MSSKLDFDSYRLASFNGYSSDFVSDVAQKVHDGECSKWNFIWLIPANIGSSVIGIIYMPISVIAHLIASLVYKIFECCANDATDKQLMRIRSKQHLAGVVDALIDRPITFVVRIGEMRTNHVTTLHQNLFACLLRSER